MPLLPEKCPPFPDVFTPKQLEDLRGLFRYAIGASSTRTVCPDWSERFPGRGCQDQLTNFKSENSSLDYGRSNAKIRYIYERVFAFFASSEMGVAGREHMADLLKSVYYPEGLTISDIRTWLADIYKVSVETQAVMGLVGLYHLYRHTTNGPDGKPQIVKSAMIIRHKPTERQDHLEFELHYPLTIMSGIPGKGTVHGVVLPRADRIFFEGRDDGASLFAPYEITARPTGNPGQTAIYPALFSRFSTDRRKMSARLLICRIEDDPQARKSQNIKTWREAQLPRLVSGIGVVSHDSVFSDPFLKPYAPLLKNEIGPDNVLWEP